MIERAEVKRRQRAPAEAENRERRADAAHVARVARRQTTISGLETRIEGVRRHPSALGVRLLAEIAANATLAPGPRLAAATLILELAHTPPLET